MDIEKDKYEVSLDIEPESVENLKDIVHSEIEEISKRFNNGTETLDDLINNYKHLKIRFELKNGIKQDLEVVELKYYLKLVEKVKTLLNELDKDNNIISDLQNEVTLKQCELDKKDKIINEMKWKPISKYNRKEYDWVLVKYFDGDYECVPDVAEKRSDDRWYNSSGEIIPFEVKYFFDMQILDYFTKKVTKED